MKTPLLRRLIYAAFILIFLIAAPLIILYTMGYRYNFTKGRVQKTGIIRITSVPNGADIYLNGVKYDLSQTPAKIEKLLPGDYEIKLSKTGYFDWQKKLPVYENGTTFAEKVILWKKSNTASLSTTTADSWLVSPDKNIVAFTNGNTVSLMNINSGIFGEISGGNIDVIADITVYYGLKLISFSPLGRYLLADAYNGAEHSYSVVDTISKNRKKIPDQDYSVIKWEATTDTLYALNKNGLWSINPSTLKTQLANSNFIAADFYLSNKDLYFIAGGILKKQTLNNRQASDIEKFNCPNCRIREIRNNKLLAVNDTGDLAIIDLNRQIPTVKAKANGFDWLNDHSLIYYNDYEIYINEFTSGGPELITRLGSPIISAIWHTDGRHLLFSSGNKINIIELDNRELRNIITIATTAGNFLTVDRSGNNIYYSLDKSGIFKLNIQ